MPCTILHLTSLATTLTPASQPAQFRIQPDSTQTPFDRLSVTCAPIMGFIRLLPARQSSTPARSNSILAVIAGHFMTKHRIYTMSVASVYPHYIAKAERKGRTKEEVDEIIRWLTGYNQKEFEDLLKNKTDFETFFNQAPQLNPLRSLIQGVICGIRVENIEEPTMREIRYLDKLVDELAKGKAMEKILRSPKED